MEVKYFGGGTRLMACDHRTLYCICECNWGAAAEVDASGEQQLRQNAIGE